MKKQFYNPFNTHPSKWRIITFTKIFPFLLLCMAIFVAQSALAQITAAASGAWSSTGTWTGGVVPTASDNVVIAAGRTVTVNSTGAVCNTLRLGSGNGSQNGTLTFSGTSSLTVTGAITMGDANGAFGEINMASNATLSLSNFIEGDPGNNVTYNAGSGTLILTGNGTMPDDLISLENLIINSGTTTLGTVSLSITGNLTINSGGTLDIGSNTVDRFSPGGTLTIANNGTIVIGGTRSMLAFFSNHSIGGSSTIHYNGSSQSIGALNSGQNYGNLVISGSGIKSIISNLSINGNLTVNSSILNIGSSVSLNRATGGGTLTIANGATVRIAGSNTLPANFATHSIGSTSTIDYRGTVAQNVAFLNSSQKYGNLIVSNSVKTMLGNITVSGTLTFGGGPPNSLVIGSNTITLEGAVANSLASYRNFTGSTTSNMILKGAFSRTIFMDTTSIGTTNALNNLTIDHASNTTTLGNSTTVYGALTFTAGKLAIGSNTLTMSGSLVNTVAGGLVGSANSNMILNGAFSRTIFMDTTSVGTTNALNNLTIDHASNTTTLGNSITVYGALTFTAGKMAIGSNTLTLSGSVVNTVAGGLVGSATSNIILKGAFNRTIFMDTTSVGTTNALNNLTIDHASNTTTLGNSTSVYGALTFTTGKLAIGSNTLTLSGSVVNTVAGGLVGSANSNLVFDGTTVNATISMDQTTPATTNKLNELTINCDPQTLTLGNSLQLAGTLFPTSGTLASGGNLTLLSTASKTANVSAGASGGGYVTGNVTVERYISSGRKWHFLSVPTSGSQTINAAWQEGTAPGSNVSNGYGTWLTNNFAGATSSGFDYQSNGPGLRKYDAATDTWITAANTTDAISSNSGYMVFVRGDRGCTSTNSNVSATILRTTGTLNQGDQASVSVGADEFASVANTLPSAIDFRNLYTTGVIDQVFYVWDPKLGGSRGLGGYQTFVNAGSDYIVTPGGGSYGSSGSICNTIQPGQAFIVHATGAAGDLQLLEGAKTSANMLVSRPMVPTTPQLRLNLIANNVVIDGLFVQIDKTFAPEIDGKDAHKMVNTSESISILNDNVLLTVERRPEFKNTDTLFLNNSGLKAQQYQFEIIPGLLQNKLMTAFLEDNYTGLKVPVSLSDTSRITIAVTTDPASKAANRFRIVFKSTVVLPLSFTGVKATEKLQWIEVNWQTANELNVKNYTIEKSSDGSNFTAVFTTSATGNNQLSAQYSWMDATAFTGKNFYRIKSTDFDGSIKYSEIVLLVSKKTKPTISVFPNPIINNQVNVQLLAVIKGNYHFTIYNAAGQGVSTGTLNVNSSNDKLIINLPSTVTKGKYQLEIKGENEFKHSALLLVM